MRELKVLLIVESGFLFDVCLAQDLSSMYLMDMAEAGTIAMAVPDGYTIGGLYYKRCPNCGCQMVL